MKLRNLKSTVLAASAAVLLSGAAANAGITYTNGDLLLGFRSATNSSIDYVVDLGLASAINNATSTQTFTLTGLNAALTSNFSASWATNPNVTFGLFGANLNNNLGSGDPRRTVYLSEPTGTTGAPVQSSSNGTPDTFISTTASYYLAQPNGPTSNSATGNPGDSGSFTTNVQTGFGVSANLPLSGIVSGGLDLYRDPESSAGSLSKTGNFAYTGGDTFTFTPTAVPEPSTAALGGLVVLGLAFRRHRKQTLA